MLTAKELEISGYLNVLTSLPSSMLMILIFPSSDAKQMYFFWKDMSELMGDTFYIFFIKEDLKWFHIATWPFFKATTRRESPWKLIQLIVSAHGPSSYILLIVFPPSKISYKATYFYVPPTAIIFSSLLNSIACTLPYSRVLMIILTAV